jgi:AraC-like DNA-binding protein
MCVNRFVFVYSFVYFPLKIMSMDFAILILMNFVLAIFIVFLLNKGRYRYSNIMLAAYFISQIIGISDGLVYYLYPKGTGIPFTFYPFIFTWAPLFFFYISSLLDKNFRLTQKHIAHFIPFIIVFSYTLLEFYSKSLETRLALTRQNAFQIDLYKKFSIVFNLQIIGYNIWAYIKYRRYQIWLKQEVSTINSAANNWLKTSLFGFLIACFIVQVGIHSSSLGFLKNFNWYFIGNFTFLAFFVILFYKAIISPDLLLNTASKEKFKLSGVEKDEAKKILAKLDEIMINKRLYADPDLTLRTLSSLSKISERTISQVINEYRKQNFFDFINSYRIKYTMELLKDNQNHKRTMLDILFEAGFNSKSTFNSAFKKQTGETPSEFRSRFA